MLRVLIADDEMPIRQWLEFCIQKIEGFKVVGTAAHGAEGFSMFRKLKPDIIITDIRMPVMDGLEMMDMIQNLDPSVYTIILTSHEDFEYARKSMSLGASEYILKTEISNESLNAVLKKAAAAIGKPGVGAAEKDFEEISDREHFLRMLVLRGQNIKLSESVVSQYDIPILKAPFYAVDILHSESSNIKFQKLDNDFFRVAVKIPVDSGNTILLGNVNKRYTSSDRNITDACKLYLNKLVSEFLCFAGVSDIYNNPCCIANAMIQAKTRVSLAFYYPQKRIFDVQDDVLGKHFNGESYKILFNKELVNQNYMGAFDVKNKMMEEVKVIKPSDVDMVKKLYLFFVTSLFHMTLDDMDSAERQIEETTNLLMSSDSLDSLNGLMEHFFDTYETRLLRKNEYSYGVRTAVTYMDEHFADSITQSEVADHIGISSEYLSRIFKEETGMKFVVYLNNLRLKHAIHLLETTNLKVYEVAEKVGYANLSYFSTVFKKNFGQNPFDYKNKIAGR